MSRIGNRILEIPAGVTVDVSDDNTVTVKGPKGELKNKFNKNITIEVEGTTVKTSRSDDTKINKSLHGTTNSLLNGMINGVSNGFQKDIEIVGVGYRCQVSGNKITLNVGYSHPVELIIPEGLKAEANGQTKLSITGIDKQKVNEFAAKIREVRKPEPYHGKGIRYADEVIRQKEGKKASK